MADVVLRWFTTAFLMVLAVLIMIAADSSRDRVVACAWVVALVVACLLMVLVQVVG